VFACAICCVSCREPPYWVAKDPSLPLYPPHFGSRDPLTGFPCLQPGHWAPEPGDVPPV
jgi:hypothetical protein